MRYRGTCLMCGCRLRGFYFASARVNKGSLRTTSPGLVFVEPCPECRFDAGSMGGPWVLDGESQERVDAYRTAKGWAA
jgi:hypothetical protein